MSVTGTESIHILCKKIAMAYYAVRGKKRQIVLLASSKLSIGKRK
jgi:hypothetical protein